MPSWAVKGAKVVCVRDGGCTSKNWPSAGVTYTVRLARNVDPGTGPGLLLEEVVNEPVVTRCGLMERGFVISRFRPVKTQEDDLREHFEVYLQDDHRAPEKADA